MAKLQAPSLSRLFRFRHFRTRLLAILLALVLGLQALVFIAVGEAANRSAIQGSEEALQVTLSTLADTMAKRDAILRKYGRLLSHDFGFKSLVSENDHATIISAFTSYRKRTGADWMFVLDLDGKVLADTLQADAVGTPFPYPALLQGAAESPTLESSSIQVIGEKAYQVVVVPLRGPLTMAWVGIGFEITDFLAGELEQQTHTSVNLAWRTPGKAPVLYASTLDEAQRHDFVAAHHGAAVRASTHIATLAGREFVAIETALVDTPAGTMVATLQRPLDEALAGYHKLRWQLLAVLALSTLLAVAAAIVIARRVTRPVLRLASGAERISAGHYDTIGDIGAHDELGDLAASFDNMVRGLVERDQVRAMLGKVVSPAIAEELLSQSIDFDGQEQEVSVLFSDIRGFTSLCEGRAPSAILHMLNDYLSSASAEIDQRAGVVDKYIGDAIMALFGAPLTAPDDPQRAVEAALAMVAALPALNDKFGRDGWPPLAIGIGIHTGIVVAGNIGSATRLNYTVLGDTVNLASRLEGLCKQYAVPVIVSEATMRRCSGIAFRELDRVRVKGKREPVSIFAALGIDAAIGAALRQQLAVHALALAAYRAGRFGEALALFNNVAADQVTMLYRRRCQQHRAHPPGPDWDAVESLDEK